MRVGDKVICVDDRNYYHVPTRGICKGIIYTLSGIFTCVCGNIYVNLKEVNRRYNMWCAKCNVTESTPAYYHIERFRPLEESEDSKNEEINIKAPNPVLNHTNE